MCKKWSTDVLIASYHSLEKVHQRNPWMNWSDFWQYFWLRTTFCWYGVRMRLRRRRQRILQSSTRWVVALMFCKISTFFRVIRIPTDLSRVVIVSRTLRDPSKRVNRWVPFNQNLLISFQFTQFNFIFPQLYHTDRHAYIHMPLEERKKYFAQQPYTCDCEACVNRWPTAEGMKVRKIEFVNNA